PESWGHDVWSHTVTTGERAQAFMGGRAVQRNVDGRGTSYLGEGGFRAANGEIFNDPRGL
ncbi:MAG: hypothetical protein ACREKB_17400, partial [Candidatus Rokuibacteriota bacterium]